MVHVTVHLPAHATSHFAPSAQVTVLEWRRQHWTGGVAKGRAEVDVVDLAFWLSQLPEERIAAVFGMWDEQMSLKDPDHEAASRLLRSVGGVRPRRG